MPNADSNDTSKHIQIPLAILIKYPLHVTLSINDKTQGISKSKTELSRHGKLLFSVNYLKSNLNACSQPGRFSYRWEDLSVSRRNWKRNGAYM